VSAGLVRRTLDYGRMIRFSHSVFALPFALTAVALAARGHGVTARQVFWIVVAMVTARSAAMGFNRLADRALDAENARTARRELPRGILGTREVGVFVALSAVGFVLAAAMLNPLCLALSPVALGIVLGYSYTKRFTAASHLVLGLALAVAPVGAWLAVRGRFALPPVILGLAVLFWVAGFDTIYACQDVDFDRERGLHSLPARLGVDRSLAVARGMHVLSVLLLLLLFAVAPLHPLYLAGVLGVAALLAWEHSLVRADDLSRVMAAFNLNGWVSLGYFACTAAAAWLVQ
jgi:4-hydroxybenzoate polyprenyltransferase